MIIFLLTGLMSFTVFSQSFFEDTEAITHFMGRNELDNYLSSNRKEGINGSYFLNFKPHLNLDLYPSCFEQKKKDSRYELVLISSFNTQQVKVKTEATQVSLYNNSELQGFRNTFSNDFKRVNLTTGSVSDFALSIWNSNLISTPSKAFDHNSNLGKELIVEGIVHAAANSTLSEKDLSRSIAETISGIYKTDEEKYQILSKLSSRFNKNYNDARNPGSDNSIFNPQNAALPSGDITLNQMFQAADSFDPLKGGVCNDISESIIMIGEQLFPKKDLITVNAGTHFGVIISDGKEHRLIDSGDSYSLNNKLFLDPEISTTNLRLSKVIDGKLKEIAVVDTETGQVVEKAFQTGKNLLKSDADISTLMAQLRNNHFSVTGGTASLSDSKVLVVVAKYENAGEKWRSYAGTGLTSQIFNEQIETKYQFHLRAGIERSIIHYSNPKTLINLSSGLRLSGMYALGQPKSSPDEISRIEMAGSLDPYTRLNFNYGNRDLTGFQLRSSVEVENSLGPSDWGGMTGQLSSVESKDFLPVLKNMTFHLNQINADVTAENKVTKKLGYYANVHYQGSNIGQSVNVISGLTVEAPQDAEILIFTGYLNSDIKGFETQNSFLGNPSGVQAGVQYKSKNGVQSSAVVRGISGVKSVEATIKVPLNGRKKDQRK